MQSFTPAVPSSLRSALKCSALSAGVALVCLAVVACGPGTQPSTPTGAAGAAAPTRAAAAKSSPEAPAAAPTTAAKPTTAASPAAAGSTPGAPAIRISGPLEGEAKGLTGAGSTFAAVLYSKWSDEYSKLTKVQVNYQSIGSGGGIKSLQDQTVDFGATDGPMTDEQMQAARGGPVFHVPTALGAVIPTYNVPGLKDTLKFTGDTLAGIYLGDIKKWNDPKLVADNPALADVDQDITVVHRTDGSGTTFIFVDYLSTISPVWQQTVGRGTSVNWPVGVGGKGSEGVSGEVKQDPYSIGYVELIYALQNNLGAGIVKNKAGKFVEPKLESVTAAAAATSANVAPDLRVSIVDAPGEAAYPIAGYTWILAYRNMTDQPKALALTRFLWWGTHDGQKFTQDLGYAPIPAEITTRSEAMIQQIAVDGKPALPAR